MDTSEFLYTPQFKDVLKLIKSLSSIKSVLTNDKLLCEIDEELYTDCLKCFFSLLVERKRRNKRYRFEGLPSNLKIIDENGEIDFESSVRITTLFSSNSLDFFHRMVADFFFEKKKSTVPLNNQIFYISCSSIYSKEKIDIFLINKDGNLRVVDDNKRIFSVKEYFENYVFSSNLKYPNIEIDFSTGTRYDLQNKLDRWSEELSRIVQDNPVLLTGAISFFDFLGWKGLWQNSNTIPLTEITKLIDSINTFTKERTAEYFKDNPTRETLSTFLSISDTIAILTPKRDSVEALDLLCLHAEIAKYVLENSCKLGYPIRGAISYGQYSVINNVMIGPGIDECASWHESCDWIGAHFTPSAQFELMKQKSLISNYIISDYEKIPLKSGYPKLNFCINWNISEDEFDSLRGQNRAILPYISAKYLNTYNFLHRQRKEDFYGSPEDEDHK